jgi:hypothetical protein
MQAVTVYLIKLPLQVVVEVAQKPARVTDLVATVAVAVEQAATAVVMLAVRE